LDTPSSESSELDTSQASSLFASLGEPAPENEPKEAPTEPAKAPEASPTEPEPVGENAVEEGADAIPIEVDGKVVKLTPAEIAEHYKNGLRQADYTKKTMDVAEQRKAAEQETAKARAERQQYAANLQQMAAHLEVGLNEQAQIDWQKLLAEDPVEYLKQQHLANDRQAKLQRIQWEQQQIHARTQAEQREQLSAFIQSQKQDLLAKLPDWNDPDKAKAGAAELDGWLVKQGFPQELLQIVGRSSHLIHGLYKAMKHDQMMDKASAAAKKVASLPQRVERPGNGTPQGLDKRTAVYQKFAKSGSLDDAASVFSTF
jgi:hypothetical protein